MVGCSKNAMLAAMSARSTAGAPTVAFSWGYAGWGNHTRELVAQVDAVEDARGFAPPLFVDIRRRRHVRAVGFRERAFAALLGPERYLWLNGLGNVAIDDDEAEMALHDPGELATLLARLEERAAAGGRVIFFCACASPLGRASGPAVRTAAGWTFPVHGVRALADEGALRRQLDDDLREARLTPLGARLELPPRWRFEPLAAPAGDDD
jgi:hypothetical protein